MAGARALWRATGMGEGDFGKPIVAIANSFTQFVPGHVHLKDMGQLVAGAVEEAGGVGKEFNTIAVDDGIAMGHDGMLYSLPSREVIADSIEYMVNAHCADAMVCISNCDKITPGMLMAAMRLNIPVVFVSGGPMEAGKVTWEGTDKRGVKMKGELQAKNANLLRAELRKQGIQPSVVKPKAKPLFGGAGKKITAKDIAIFSRQLATMIKSGVPVVQALEIIGSGQKNPRSPSPLVRGTTCWCRCAAIPAPPILPWFIPMLNPAAWDCSRSTPMMIWVNRAISAVSCSVASS